MQMISRSDIGKWSNVASAFSLILIWQRQNDSGAHKGSLKRGVLRKENVKTSADPWLTHSIFNH